MAAKKTTTRQPSQADLLRLGAGVAGVKAQTDPKAWKSFVKSTHKQGYSVVDTVNGVPAQLRGRTQDYLKKTAASQVAQAYAPIDKGLNDSESRVKAWDAKRATDNRAYQQWVADQTATLSAQGRLADATVAERQRVLMDGLKVTAAAAQPQAQANVQGMQGTVSDFSQSSALKGVGDAAARNAAIVGSAAQQSEGLSKLGESTRQLTDNAVSLGAQAMEGRRQSDTSKALSDIFDKRSSANIQRAADYLKSYGDLQSTELTKAQGNRDSSMAASQLGLNQDKLTADMLNKRAARVVTKRGQDKTANTAAARIKAAADAKASTPNKYGILPAAWTALTTEQRQKVIKDFAKTGSPAAGDKDKYGNTPKQQAAANDSMKKAQVIADRYKVGFKAGDWKGLMSFLVSAKNLNPVYAQAAAQRALNGGTIGPNTQNALRRRGVTLKGMAAPTPEATKQAIAKVVGGVGNIGFG